MQIGSQVLPWFTVNAFAASRLFTTAEFPVSQYLDVLKRTHSQTPPEHPDLQHKVKNHHHNKQSSDNKQRIAHHAGMNAETSAAVSPCHQDDWSTLCFSFTEQLFFCLQVRRQRLAAELWNRCPSPLCCLSTCFCEFGVFRSQFWFSLTLQCSWITHPSW